MLHSTAPFRALFFLIACLLAFPISTGAGQERSVETVTKLHIRNHITLGRQAENNGNDALAAGHYEIALTNFIHPDLGVLVMGRRGRPADYNEAARLLADVGKKLANQALGKDRILINKEEEQLARVHRRHVDGEPRDISWLSDGGALLYYLYSHRYQDFHDLALLYVHSMDGGPIKEYVRYWSREKRFRSLLKHARGRLKRLQGLLDWPPEKTYVTPQEQKGLDLLPETQRALGKELARQIENWLGREQPEFKEYTAGLASSSDSLIPTEDELTGMIESTQAKKASLGSLKNAEKLTSVLRFYRKETGFSEDQVESFQQRIVKRAEIRGDWLMERNHLEHAKDYYRLAEADEKYNQAKKAAREKRHMRRDSLKKSLEDLNLPHEGSRPDIGKSEKERRNFEQKTDELADELGL